MKIVHFSWTEKETPEELHPLLEALGEEYPIVKEGDCRRLYFIKHEEQGSRLLYNQNNTTTIYYSDLTSAARSIGSALSGIGKDRGEISEKLPFEKLGLMLECSRNAIITVDYFKQWLRRMALMGCNIAMLYTKDGYELPGENYFGYLRGRYLLEELREVDEYAARLGIEMVGCIQALGHLEPVLRWSAYNEIRDTSSVLLTTEEKSYELIGKMLDFFSAAFKSRRIHLGMDETHDLGRGRYMDLNGYRRGFDIYNDHLSRVSEKCKERGLSYMIWSDMFFRMGSKTQDYYDKNAVIPDDVKEKIPEDIQLVYWDYYHYDKEFYIEWIKRHKELGFTPVMASGIQTWQQLWHHYRETVKTVDPCIEACLEENVKELVFTAWGDDGMACDFDSAQAGLCYAAEKCYSPDNFDEQNAARRFNTICAGNYDLHVRISKITDNRKDIRATHLLWDDPILGMYWKNQRASKNAFWQEIEKSYAEIEKSIQREMMNDVDAKHITHIAKVVEFLRLKINFKMNLDTAYEEMNLKKLEQLKADISELIKVLDELIASFRTYWNARFKRFGFEFIHNRLGGQRERYKELSLRIDELLTGKVHKIPELEETAGYQTGNFSGYHQLATASYFV